MSNRPIGIFDSGIGGLTVAQEIYTHFPHENTIYVGDTARVPYGNRSPETVTNFSREIVTFLVKQEVKAIVVACSTASAQALKALQHEFPIPIYGVIEAAATKAAGETKTKHVGVIGTRGTIQSKRFQTMIKSAHPQITVTAKACPLFVPLAEEGITTGPIASQVAHHYLSDFKSTSIDTLILGCTHYPLLENVIQTSLGPEVRLINVGQALIEELKNNPPFPLNPQKNPGNHQWYVTDDPEGFSRLTTRFLNPSISVKAKAITLNSV
jgi:glutamate racemase